MQFADTFCRAFEVHSSKKFDIVLKNSMNFTEWTTKGFLPLKIWGRSIIQAPNFSLGAIVPSYHFLCQRRSCRVFVHYLMKNLY